MQTHSTWALGPARWHLAVQASSARPGHLCMHRDKCAVKTARGISCSNKGQGRHETTEGAPNSGATSSLREDLAHSRAWRERGLATSRCRSAHLHVAGLFIKGNYSFCQGEQSLYFGNLICWNLIHLSKIYLREFPLNSRALHELAGK